MISKSMANVVLISQFIQVISKSSYVKLILTLFLYFRCRINIAI